MANPSEWVEAVVKRLSAAVSVYKHCVRTYKWSTVAPLIGHPELRLIRTFVNYTWSSPKFTIFLPKCWHLANQDFTSVSVRVIPLSTISNQSCEPLADNYTHTFAACLVIKCSLLVSWSLGYLTGERGFQSVKVGMDMVKETADCFKPVFCSCSVDRTWTYLLSWDLCFATHYLYYGVVVSQINKSFVMLFRRQPNVWVCVCVSSCACVYVSVCYVCV